MGEAALFIGIGIGLAVGAFATWLWASRATTASAK